MAIEKLKPFGVKFGSDKNNATKADLDDYYNSRLAKLNEIKTALQNAPTKRIIPKVTKTNCFINIGNDGYAKLVDELPVILGGKIDSDKIANGAVNKNKFKQSTRISKEHLSNNFKLENRHFYKGNANLVSVSEANDNNKPEILVYSDTLKDTLPMSKFNNGCFTERTLKNVRLTSEKIAPKSIHPEHFAKDFILPKQKTGEHILSNCFANLDIFNNDVKYKITVPDNMCVIDDYTGENVVSDTEGVEAKGSDSEAVELKYINLRIVLDYFLTVKAFASDNEEGAVQHPAYIGDAYQVWGNLACIMTQEPDLSPQTYDLKEAMGFSIMGSNAIYSANEQVRIHAEFVIAIQPQLEDAKQEEPQSEAVGSDSEAVEEQDEPEQDVKKHVVTFTIKGIAEELKLDSYLIKVVDASVRLKCTLTKNTMSPEELDVPQVPDLEDSQPTEKYNVEENIKQSKIDDNTYKAEYDYKKENVTGYKNNNQFGNMTMLLMKEPNKKTLKVEKTEISYNGFKEIQKSNTTEIIINNEPEVAEQEERNKTTGTRQTNKVINDGLNLEEINTNEEKEEIKSNNEEPYNINTTKTKKIVWKNTDLITEEIKQAQAEIIGNEIEDDKSISINENIKVNLSITKNVEINYTVQTNYQKENNKQEDEEQPEDAKQVVTGTRVTFGQCQEDNNILFSIKANETIKNNPDGTYEYKQEKELEDEEGNKHEIKIEEKKELILQKESGEQVEYLNQKDSFTWNKSNLISQTITHEVFNKDGDKISGATKNVATVVNTISLEGRHPTLEVQKNAELLILDDLEQRNKEKREALVITNAQNDFNIISNTNAKSFNTEALDVVSHGDLLGYEDIRTDLQNKVNQYRISADNNIEILPDDPLNIDVSLDNYRERAQSILVNDRRDIFEQYLIRRTESETIDKVTDYELIEPQDNTGEPRVRPIFTPILTSINFKEVALEHDLIQSNKDKQDLKATNKKLNNIVKKYKMDNESKDEQIESLKNTVRAQDSHLQKMKTALSEKDTQILNLNNELQEKSELIQSKENEIQSNANLSEQEKTELQSQINALKEDVKQSNNKQKQLAKEKEMIKNNLKELKTKRKQDLLRINELEQEKNQYKTEREQLSKQIIEKDKTIIYANSKLKQVTQENTALKKTIESTNNEISLLKDKITQEQNKIIEIENTAFANDEEKNKALKKQQLLINTLKKEKKLLEDENRNNKEKLQSQENEINELNTQYNELAEENDDLANKNNEVIKEYDELKQQNNNIIKESKEAIRERDAKIAKLSEDVAYRDGVIKSQNVYALLEKKKDQQIKMLESSNQYLSKKVDKAEGDLNTQKNLLKIVELINNNEDIGDLFEEDSEEWIIYFVLEKIFENRALTVKEATTQFVQEEEYEEAERIIEETVAMITRNNLVQLLGATTEPLEAKIEKAQNKINEMKDDIENKNRIIENDQKAKENFKKKQNDFKLKLQKANKQVELRDKQLLLKDEVIKKQDVERKELITSMDLKQQELEKERKLTAEQKKEISLYREEKTQYERTKKDLKGAQNKIKTLKNDIEKEREKQEDIKLKFDNAKRNIQNVNDLTGELDYIEKDYNQLIDDYKTSKIREDDFNAKREGLLSQLSTLKNKYDNPENNSYFVRQIKYTQIERLKGIKDKIEVGVTLPVIERRREATLTIKKEPKLILQQNDRFVAIKVAPICLGDIKHKYDPHSNWFAVSHSLAFAVTHVKLPNGTIEEVKPKTFLFYNDNIQKNNKTVAISYVPYTNIKPIDDFILKKISDLTEAERSALLEEGVSADIKKSIENIKGSGTIEVLMPTFFMLLRDYIVLFKNRGVQIAFIKVLNAKQKYIETHGIYRLLSDIIVKKGVCNDWIPVSFIKAVSIYEHSMHWDSDGWASMFIRGNIDEILTYPDKKKSRYTLGNIPKYVTNFPGQVIY